MDTNENYTATIEVSASPATSYDAVATKMGDWWTETVEGGLRRAGDTVKAIFPPDFGHWTFEAKTMEHGKAIEMVCIDAHHHVEGEPEEIDREWMGTRIVWEFEERGDKTLITLSHVGLTPQLKCWDICMDGWNFFFKQSLKDYLDGKTASPHSAT